MDHPKGPYAPGINNDGPNRTSRGPFGGYFNNENEKLEILIKMKTSRLMNINGQE
jgi:hypothetical protein